MQRLIFKVLMFAALVAPAYLHGAYAADPIHFGNKSVIPEYNVMVPMRDGVRLSTDIYRPAKPGKYPVILTRDTYDNGSRDQDIAEGYTWAERGYVFIHQDVRGRYDSDGGQHYPYKYEAEDGYDTQVWAGEQPWSNGKVGMMGGSYLASVQWLSAPLRAPSLTALAPRMTPYNYYQDVAYTGGAFQLSSRIGWAALISGRTNQIRHYDWDEKLLHLPLKTLDKAIGHDLPHFRDWLAHPSHDEYWMEYNVEAQADQIDVPAYNIAGWYDVFLRGNLTSFADMGKKARSEKNRHAQKLIIGPWPHTAAPSAKLGELDFTDAAVVSFDDIHIKWFDYWLKGTENGVLNEAPVRLFVMGENKWRDEQEWPLARTQYTKYYFNSKGSANSAQGNGTLSTEKPEAKKGHDQFVYDPNNPVPTLGGNLMFKTTPAGPYDQAALEERKDILVYTTGPLEADTEVTGPIEVTLYAASSALDTDFTAKLVDVHPDGKAYNLADGIIRARHRESFKSEKLLTPGKVYEYTIDLWATSNLFKKGHKIRVDISSSNFPRFDRNPNTGHKFAEDAEIQTAEQTIYHTAEYPSYITLPIIPR
ncbi:CocE/NonD family hydrolase [Kordiimonas pumila]|uniref:CocE/NonD family hydrolase n=1 Tax=Kordiimonas pumila TaxID=2161677 RepID=A0ABV7D4D8_9PROT|nr:CocE/NonD family hydrolase [Kordiimonas pumila]